MAEASGEGAVEGVGVGLRRGRQSGVLGQQAPPTPRQGEDEQEDADPHRDPGQDRGALRRGAGQGPTLPREVGQAGAQGLPGLSRRGQPRPPPGWDHRDDRAGAEVVQGLGDVGQDARGRRRVPTHLGGAGDPLDVAVGPPRREGCVEDRPDPVDVRSDRVVAGDRVDPGQDGIDPQAGDAHLAVVADEDVRRAQAAVRDPLGVRGLDRAGDLVGDAGRLGGGQRGGEVVAQHLSGAPLGDDDEEVLGGEDVEDPHDAPVVDGGCRAGRLVEVRGQGRVGGDQPQGHLAVQGAVDGPPDLCAVALLDEVVQGEPADLPVGCHLSLLVHIRNARPRAAAPVTGAPRVRRGRSGHCIKNLGEDVDCSGHDSGCVRAG